MARYIKARNAHWTDLSARRSDIGINGAIAGAKDIQIAKME